MKIHFCFACFATLFIGVERVRWHWIRTNADQSPYRKCLSIIYKSRTKSSPCLSSPLIVVVVVVVGRLHGLCVCANHWNFVCVFFSVKQLRMIIFLQFSSRVFFPSSSSAEQNALIFLIYFEYYFGCWRCTEQAHASRVYETKPYR